MRLVIGDKNASSWSLRPWLVLKQAGIAFEEHVMLFEREDWRDAITELSPGGRVPVLHDGSLVVWESLAICEHLAERFQDARLWPDDPASRARARALSCEMHAGFAALRRELPFDVTARAAKPLLSSDAEADLRRIEQIWSSARGPFLFGAFSIADAMFAPVALRFQTWGVALGDPAAQAFMDTMLGLPAIDAWERGAAAEVEAHAARGRPAGGARSASDCYAVIFSSQLDPSAAGYEKAAERMLALARTMPGFLGAETARGGDGFGITVSYWDSLATIRRWKEHPEHARIQEEGRKTFYLRYETRVANVERRYAFSRTR
jgi:glutathione S-transferase